MPNLNYVEAETRRYASELSTLTGLQEDVVKTVLSGIRLLALRSLYEEGIADKESGEIGNIRKEIAIPNIATLVLMPVNRKQTDELEGYTFKGKLHFQDKFLQDAKRAYYCSEDFLLEHVQSKFSDILVDKHKSLL